MSNLVPPDPEKLKLLREIAQDIFAQQRYAGFSIHEDWWKGIYEFPPVSKED